MPVMRRRCRETVVWLPVYYLSEGFKAHGLFGAIIG